METNRRDFLKVATLGGAAATVFGFDLKPAYAQLRELKIARATETRSTCPYCSVSCGVIIYTLGDKAKNVTPQVIHVEGDADHPINRGTLCPKGASLEQDILNDRRLLKPQVRRPGTGGWQDISWDDALNEIARWVKKSRDDTFVENDQQARTVNRCECIAWTGGCVSYAVENNRIAKGYLLMLTNPAFVVKEGFKVPEDGLFSGFDPSTLAYDKATWNYGEGGDLSKSAGADPPAQKAAARAAAPPALPANTAYDLALQHPRCVFQLLKKQYSRYTPEMVERITGIPRDQFLKAADLFTSIRKNGDMAKAATIIYAVGWTQHTYGTQIIRTAAMLQLLLGNVGRAGGGVNALRGHSNIQDATDMAGDVENHPGEVTDAHRQGDDV